MQEVGSGEPVLFINGTGGPGAYFAPLLAALRGFRCLVLDRPGWGLSDPVDYSRAAYRTVVAELLRDAQDALGVDRACVVGGSIGTCGRCGWPRPTPRGWNAWSCWAAGR